MYEDTQEEFVKALTKGKQLSSEDGPLKVAITESHFHKLKFPAVAGSKPEI